MSAIQIHLDEDADSQALLNALRHRGLDVTSSRERGLLRCTDLEQLAWADEHGRVIFTYNAADFFRLHALFLQRGSHHAGNIIGDQQTVSIGKEVRSFLKLSETKTKDEMKDHLEFLNNWQ